MKVKIGTVCRQGHYNFTADPEYNTPDSAQVADIYVEFYPSILADAEYFEEIVDEANDQLADILATWRGDDD